MTRELDCYPLPPLSDVCARLEELIEDKEERMMVARNAGRFDEADQLARELALHEQSLGWLRDEADAELAEQRENERAELAATTTKAAA